MYQPVGIGWWLPHAIRYGGTTIIENDKLLGPLEPSCLLNPVNGLLEGGTALFSSVVVIIPRPKIEKSDKKGRFKAIDNSLRKTTVKR